jgi:hypothetical protein
MLADNGTTLASIQSDMKKPGVVVVLVVLAFAAGGVFAWAMVRPQPKPVPDTPALVTQMREVARLETLEVNLYKKVALDPEPEPAGSLWGDVANWVKFNVNPPHGKAIVFAVAHVGLDVSQMLPNHVLVVGDRIDVVLPPLETQVELEPAQTEVIGSNLDTAQTAQLFDLAKSAFKRQVEADAALRAKARASAERSLRALFITAGFREVQFVTELPPRPGNG